MRLHLLKAIIFPIFLLLITPSLVLGQPITNPPFQPPPSSLPAPTTSSQPSSTGTQNRHPLRPKPKEFTNWEKNRPGANYTQTLFCAQRPTAVQKQKFLKTDKELSLQITGTFLSNFEEFVTPLLSITNKDKDDYDLSYEQKAQRYLADYLGGRAYYELEIEPTKQELEANPQLQYDLFIRLGVFRKLAPLSLQDKYKRAMIYRASGIPAAANPSGLEPLDFFTDYYGFEPASPIVQNYPVTCLRGNNIVAFTQYNDFTNPCGSSQNVRLNSFDKTNWAPLPEEFDTPEEYASASATWKLLGGGQIDPDTGKIIEFGKWAKAWSYVPCFPEKTFAELSELLVLMLTQKGTLSITPTLPAPTNYPAPSPPSCFPKMTLILILIQNLKQFGQVNLGVSLTTKIVKNGGLILQIPCPISL